MRLEPHSHRGLIEVNVLHEVGLLVPISANHSLELKLVQNLRLLVANIWGVHDLVYPFETSLVRDKLVDIVYHDGET